MEVDRVAAAVAVEAVVEVDPAAAEAAVGAVVAEVAADQEVVAVPAAGVVLRVVGVASAPEWALV